MSYRYEDLKATLFTDEGQRTFLKVRDRSKSLIEVSGAATLDRCISSAGGDSWLLLACVDRLVELGELREVPTNGAAQDRIFVRPR